MGKLNLKKIKAKAAEIKQKEKERKEKGSSGIFLKIPEGTIEVRVLPPWSEEGLLSKEIYTHFRLPPGNTTCVDIGKSYPELGMDGPIAEVIDEFSEVLDVWKLKSKATPKINVYLPDCEVNQDNEELDKSQLGKVLIASPSVGVYNDIIKKISNPRIGDITDPNEGYYITIEKVVGAKWQDTAYNVELIPGACPIHDDEDEQEKILASLHDLDKMFPPPDDEKLSEIQQAAVALAKHLEKLAREQGHNVSSSWAGGGRKRRTTKPTAETEDAEEEELEEPAEAEEDSPPWDDDEEEAAPPPKAKTLPKTRKRKDQEADSPFESEEGDEEPPRTKTKSSRATEKPRSKASSKPECFADPDVYKIDDEQSVACTRCMWEVPCMQAQKKAGTLLVR